MLTCHSSSIWCPTLHRLVPQTVVFHVWTSLSSRALSPLSLISSSFPLILSLIFIFSLSLAESLSPPTDPLPHLSLRSHSSHSALRRSTHPHSYLFYHLYVPRRMVGCLACTVFFFFSFFFFFFFTGQPPIFLLAVYPLSACPSSRKTRKTQRPSGSFLTVCALGGSKSQWEWPWIGLHPVWGGDLYILLCGGCVLSSYPRYLTHYLSLSCPLRHRL